jgi:hypothetical protein
MSQKMEYECLTTPTIETKKQNTTFCTHNDIKYFIWFTLWQKLNPEIGLWLVHWNNGKQNFKNWVLKKKKKKKNKIRPCDLRQVSESHNMQLYLYVYKSS